MRRIRTMGGPRLLLIVGGLTIAVLTTAVLTRTVLHRSGPSAVRDLAGDVEPVDMAEQ